MNIQIIKLITVLLIQALTLKNIVAGENHQAFSLEDRQHFALKLAGTIGHLQTKSELNGRQKSDSHFAPGFMTQISWQYRRFEISASSYVTIARYHGLDFRTDEVSYRDAHGRFRNIAITPTIKYSPGIFDFKDFHFFIGGGLLLSQRTYNLSAAEVSEDIDLNIHKVNYEARGAIIQLGLEQQKTPSRAHPLYFEIALISTKSMNSSLINTENFRKTDIISKSKARREIGHQKILFSFGLTVL